MNSILEEMNRFMSQISQLEKSSLGYAEITVINEKEKDGPVLSYTRNGITKTVSVSPPPGSTLEDYLSLTF